MKIICNISCYKWCTQFYYNTHKLLSTVRYIHTWFTIYLCVTRHTQYNMYRIAASRVFVRRRISLRRRPVMSFFTRVFRADENKYDKSAIYHDCSKLFILHRVATLNVLIIFTCIGTYYKFIMIICYSFRKLRRVKMF